VLFVWDDWNLEHIAGHGVAPREAETVVRYARKPYPVAIDDEKWLVLGRTKQDRLIHVIFVRKDIDQLDLLGFDAVELDEAIRRGVVKAVYVIHAMPASSRQTRLHRRRTNR
jgi:hypothetical protein